VFWQNVSIRMSLLRNFVGVIILLAGCILVITVFAARSAVTSLSESVMNVSIELTKNRLREFFEPVMQELFVARQWGETGVLDRSDPEGVKQLMLPVLEQYPQILSVLVADETGREFMLMRSGDGFASRETNVEAWGTRTRWHEWRAGQGETIESWRDIEYDPRRRPWFEGAFARRQSALAESTTPAVSELVHWTTPYIFFTSKQPGITGSIVFQPPDAPMSVVAIDIHLSSISRYTESLEVTPHGGVIVLTQDMRIVGLPRSAHFEDSKARQNALLQQPEDIGLQLANDASSAFRTNMSNLARPPVQFESGGDAWWGKGSLFELGPDQQLWVGVVIPERDMIDNLARLRIWIIGIALSVIILAIVRAMMLARWFSKPIEQLVRQSGNISRGDLEEREPIVSRVLEVQALAEAQADMRTALRSLLKMERDMQLARQIQQQSFPAKLPKVAGYEIAAWADPADETGGDIYDIIGFAPVDDARDESTDPIRLTNDNPRYTILVLADATGHGIGPALAVSQFRSMVRMAIRTGRDLDAIAHHVNDQLCTDLPSGRFITAWMAMLDAEEHVLHSFSAGHAPLFHYVATRNECDVFDADIMPFGITRQIAFEHRAPIKLEKGDFFIVCSDGIMEMQNTRNEQFGKIRLIDFIKRHRNDSPTLWLKSLQRALEEFADGAVAGDDITAVVLKRA